jgi:hypothetical protein
MKNSFYLPSLRKWDPETQTATQTSKDVTTTTISRLRQRKFAGRASKAKRDMTMPEFKKKAGDPHGEARLEAQPETHKLCGCSSIISDVVMTFATLKHNLTKSI